MTTIKIKIEGMSCGHCKANVEKRLSNVSNIETVSVDLQSGTATLSSADINIEEVSAVITKAGYTFVGIL